MELQIKNEVEFNDAFLDYLIEYIQKIFIGGINPKKLHNADLYFNSFSNLTNKFKKYISPYEILVSGIYNLVYYRDRDRITIMIDNAQIFPGTQAKINILCKEINDGNLILPAYPIFTETFKQIKNDLNYIYDLYSITGGF